MTAEPVADLLLDPLVLPEDRLVLTPAEVAARARERAGLFHVIGAEGVGAALVARALALGGAHRVLYVASDVDAARRATADLAFLARGLPFDERHRATVPDGDSPLMVAPSESSPWADVRPDRRAQMSRVAALFHIAKGLPWRFVVTTAADKYPQDLKFEVVKDKCPLLDPFELGQDVQVSFDIRGNEYNGKYFVNLACWKIQAAGESVAPSGASRQPAARQSPASTSSVLTPIGSTAFSPTA